MFLPLGRPHFQDSCYVLSYHMFRYMLSHRSSAHTYNSVIKFKVKMIFYGTNLRRSTFTLDFV